MLKITTVAAGPAHIRLKVEGSVAQEWVPVLRREVLAGLATSARVELDFRDVAYVDGSGLELLQQLPQDRIDIIDCPPLIRELLPKELA